MEVNNLVPDSEVYFGYNEKITKGIFKGIQKTSTGKPVKGKNRLIEIINKRGNSSIIIIPKEVKLFNTEEELLEYQEQLELEDKKRLENIENQYLQEVEEIKNQLNEIDNINQLKLGEELSSEENEYYYDLFADDYTFTLKDGTNVRMSKNYKCILHNAKFCEGVDVYEIEDGEFFKCFDCGSILVGVSELINKNNITGEFRESYLFPKNWGEDKIVDWLMRHKDN